MGSPEHRAARQELIQRLMLRLCASDLTLAEAKTLRDRLAELLAHEDRSPARPEDMTVRLSA